MLYVALLINLHCTLYTRVLSLCSAPYMTEWPAKQWSRRGRIRWLHRHQANLLATVDILYVDTPAAYDCVLSPPDGFVHQFRLCCHSLVKPKPVDHIWVRCISSSLMRMPAFQCVHGMWREQPVPQTSHGRLRRRACATEHPRRVGRTTGNPESKKTACTPELPPGADK